jgi:disulfide bond formation protein DsbB
VTNLHRAHLLALLTPAALLAGALGSQYVGGLYPCEMCHWQRWPHYAALGLAVLGFVPAAPRRLLVVLAASAILISGAIGVFHAGVEYRWWEGLTTCSTNAVAGSSADIMNDIFATPLVRCDQAQWSLAGISLAGFNAIISLVMGAVILWLTSKRP